MTFKTVQEAFNHYRTATTSAIETRAAEIKNLIQTDANADMDALNIELDGLNEAKTNIEERSAKSGNNQQFNPVTGMNFTAAARMAADEDILASREYRSAFCKTMLNQQLSSEESAVYQRANQLLAAERRAAFISTTEAAAVIPTQMLDEIFQKAADSGGILSLCRRFDIPANLAVPVATPEDAAEWHVEGEEVTPTNKKPTHVKFEGFELMKVFSISAAARSMSINAYESYLQQELNRVIVTALQIAAVKGTGEGQPLGLLAPDVIKAELLNQAPAYETFAKTAATLKRGYSYNATWTMNNATLYNYIMSTLDATGRPIFNEAREGGADRILGKPIVIDDFMPDGTILFGDFQYYGMNYPQDILLEVSRDSSFRKGLIDYRSMAVADGKPIIDEAFVKLTLKS